MPRYIVNATVSFPAWVEVEADNEHAAEGEAAEMGARDFQYDDSNGDVEFNVTPAVEAA